MKFSVITERIIRLDAYLCEVLEISRRQARDYCENNLVRVNNRISRAGLILKNADEISIAQSIAPVVPGQIASTLKIEILYQNQDFIILNKPVATHCVRLKNSDQETISDWLATNFPETLSASNDMRESGLVNRLDYYTSGIIIAAKSKQVWLELRSDKEMLKTYFALVVGNPRPQTIELALENKSNSKVGISKEGPIRTTEILTSKQINSKYSLVKIQGHNFSRHQIRAHLSHIESPLLGDEIYKGEKSTLLKREGFFLHSENLKFQFKDELFNFSAQSQELKLLQAKN